MSSRTSRVTMGVIASVLRFLVQILLQIILVPLILRIAGKEVLGAYAILFQAIVQIGMVDLGMGTAMSRFLAYAYGLDDRWNNFKDVLSTGRTFLLFTNLIYALILLILSFFVGPLFSLSAAVEQQVKISLYIFAIWTIIRTPLVVYGFALIAVQKLADYNYIGLLGNLLRFVGALVLVSTGTGLIGLMFANVLSEAVMFLCFRWRFLHSSPNLRLVWKILNKKTLKSMLKFGLLSMVFSIGTRLTYNTDNIIVGYLFGAVAASIYYSTQVPAFMGYNLLWKLPQNASPAVVELFARKDMDTLRSSYYRLSRYILLLAFPLALGILLFNRSMIELWTGLEQYAGNLMTISLSIFTFSATMTCLNATYLFALGNIRNLAFSTIISGFIKVGLSFWLGHLLGLPGVMLASVIADGLFFIYTIFLLYRELDISLLNLMHDSIIPSIGSMLPIFLVSIIIFVNQSVNNNLNTILIQITIFTVVWLFGSWLFGLNIQEKHKILSIAGKIKGKLIV